MKVGVGVRVSCDGQGETGCAASAAVRGSVEASRSSAHRSEANQVAADLVRVRVSVRVS